jgi:hypothetical protein
MRASGYAAGVRAVVGRRTRGGKREAGVKKILAGLGGVVGSPARIFLLVKRGCGERMPE